MRYTVYAVLAAVLLSACSDDHVVTETTPQVTLTTRSVTPVLLKGLPSTVQAFSLISSDDQLSGSPNFIFGGSADGNGLMKNSDGTFTILVNNEDNFSVSRIKLDATFKPISGDYVLNSTFGRWRLCSATLATPAEHGFGPLFLTNGESSSESMIHAIDPSGPANTSRLLPALGKWSAEQTLPLPKTTYPGKTVLLIGDDDSGAQGGQVAMYVSNTVGDLDGGTLYILGRADNNVRERDMVVGQTYPVVFRSVAVPPNQQAMTGAQINTRAVELKTIPFGRVEDLDYRKDGVGREVYFNVTGLAATGVNADFSRTKYGRTYKLTLDAANPLNGTLEVVLDGDDRTGKAGKFQNPDNILVTKNYAYISEDPNGYGDETHDSYMYQYDLNSKALTVVAEMDHHRGDAKYNVGGDGVFGSWEYAGFIDISDIVGIADTFLLSLQPHTWTGDKYKNPDGGAIQTTQNQASELVVLKGLPR